jgi:hypothetical protein
MAQTNAQRQAAYRARHLKDADGLGERLNTLINAASKQSLERLATLHGMTQRAVLEKLISDAERAVLDTMAPGDYFAIPPSRAVTR